MTRKVIVWWFLYPIPKANKLIEVQNSSLIFEKEITKKYESIEKKDFIPIIPETKKFNLINGFLELTDFKIKVDNQELSFIQTLGVYAKNLEINFNSKIGIPLFFISSKIKKEEYVPKNYGISFTNRKRTESIDCFST